MRVQLGASGEPPPQAPIPTGAELFSKALDGRLELPFGSTWLYSGLWESLYVGMWEGVHFCG